MGCDIHLHQEVRAEGIWHHYRDAPIPRNYRLFAKLANVRNVKPFKTGFVMPLVSGPRGFPIDASYLTCRSYDDWNPDAHSASWIDATEILAFEDWLIQDRIDRCIYETDTGFKMPVFGYLFGNTWGSFIKCPQDRPSWLEDIRWVFWFDN